jgi:hypothetical protein
VTEQSDDLEIADARYIGSEALRVFAAIESVIPRYRFRYFWRAQETGAGGPSYGQFAIDTFLTDQRLPGSGAYNERNLLVFHGIPAAWKASLDRAAETGAFDDDLPSLVGATPF